MKEPGQVTFLNNCTCDLKTRQVKSRIQNSQRDAATNDGGTQKKVCIHSWVNKNRFRRQLDYKQIVISL